MKFPRRSRLLAACGCSLVVADAAASTSRRCSDAFVVRPPETSSARRPRVVDFQSPSTDPSRGSSLLPQKRTDGGGVAGVGPLYAIVDVPPGFFTTMFIALGLTNTLIRKVQREALEEAAWRARIEESREARLADDPTLSELDLIREEADARPRPYGEEAKERREREERETGRSGPRLLTIEDGPTGLGAKKRYKRDEYGESGAYRPMTDDEIDDFEVVYGVSYDPYYDEPYEEDELPDDVKFNVDRLYGDRRYEDGEVFYRDESTGLYWRQGCKPRVKKMWGVS